MSLSADAFYPILGNSHIWCQRSSRKKSDDPRKDSQFKAKGRSSSICSENIKQVEFPLEAAHSSPQLFSGEGAL